MEIPNIIVTLVQDDDYEEIMESLPDFAFGNLVREVGELFKVGFGSDHRRVHGTVFEETMKRVKRHAISRRKYLLERFVSEHNKRFCWGACFDCMYNYPCELCNRAIPFDIFNVEGAQNKFAYSCRPTMHACLSCKIKMGKPMKRKHI